MKANAERIEKNTVLLEIEVDAERFSSAMEKAYRKVVKRVNIPGFRKGKTPRPILERYVGKEVLYEEAIDELVPEAYYQAVLDTGIEPIDQPKVEVVQAEEGKPVILKATVQVKPEVELGQYKGLEITRPQVEVKEEDVDKELERLQNRHAKLLTLEEGTVENGDIAVIDFLGKVDGEPFEGGEGKDYSLEVGSRSFIEGFEEQMIGMSVGETKEIRATFPEKYHNGELAGKEAVFTVTVKGLKRKELAPLDDEFAKDVSEFDTLEELRSDITNRLKQAAESRIEARVRQDAVTKAVDNAGVEIPDVMIDTQVMQMLSDLETRLNNQGITIQDYFKYTESTPEQLRDQMRPEAERSVKTRLVLNAIARAEGIKAGEDELKEEAAKIAGFYKQDPDEFLAAMEKEGQMGALVDRLIVDKTVRFLVDNAVIKEEHTNGETAE
ncbi:MAG: trigger factor [Peptococcaceae bacterium]|nr:trigger factor [Peptococcaceae bacterium]